MEDKTIDELTLRELLSSLTDREQEIMQGHLEGMTPEERGVSRYRVDMLTHRMACLGGIDWRCNVCGPLPASQFGWDSKGLCLSCESTGMKWTRTQREKWTIAVEAGETRICRVCGTVKAAAMFSAVNNKTCIKCLSAKALTRRNAKKDSSRRAAETDG